MNTQPYIGIPYQSLGRTLTGLDCWGVVYLVYRRELGIELPSYSDSYSDAAETREVALAVKEGRSLWKQVNVPEVYDVALFHLKGEPTHVGVYIGDGKFLHVRRKADVCIERLSHPLWKATLEGFYHYVG